MDAGPFKYIRQNTWFGIFRTIIKLYLSKSRFKKHAALFHQHEELLYHSKQKRRIEQEKRAQCKLNHVEER